MLDNNTKFGYTYRLLIRDYNQATQIEIDSFTIEFNVNRTLTSSLNSATFRIYGLSENIRAKLRQDPFTIQTFDKTYPYYKQVIFQAGYQNKYATCFAGNLTLGYDYRSGPDIVSFLECQDGLVSTSNSFVNFSVNKGQSTNDLLKNLINDLTSDGILGQGYVSNFDNALQKGKTFIGNTYDLLKNSVDANLYIDLETINILKNNDAISSESYLINSGSGLLNTPIRQNSYLTLDCMFEPKPKLGSLITIESTVNSNFNGSYRLDGIHHNGIISSSAASSVKTTFQCFAGTQKFNNL